MEKSFSRCFDSLAEIFEFTREFYSTEQVDEGHRFAIDFAVEEIFTNCVKFHPEGRRNVSIGLTREEDRVRVVVTDVGVKAFDVTRAPEVKTDAPLDQRRPGGLGLHLTKKLMDEIDYEYDDGTSRIVMTKVLR